MSFYLVDNELFKDLKYAYGEQIHPVQLGDAIRCEKCGRYLTLKPWMPPYRINLSRINVGDFIMGSIQHFAVSDNFKKAYEKTSLKGLYDFQPVELFYKKQRLDNLKYYYPRITLSTARIDVEKSGIVYADNSSVCSLCQKGDGDIVRLKSITFENPEEIIEDVFDTKFFPGPIVSERFKQFIQENKFTNLLMKDLKSYVPSWLQPTLYNATIKWSSSKGGK